MEPKSASEKKGNNKLGELKSKTNGKSQPQDFSRFDLRKEIYPKSERNGKNNIPKYFNKTIFK